jgi:hypothetical protein
MAAIDKMFGTQVEHDKLRNWIARHRPKWRICIYSDSTHLPPDAERSIAVFSVSQDKWLARKCHLPVVKRNLEQQYKGSSPTGRIVLTALGGVR